MFVRLVKAMKKKIDGGSYNGLALDHAACYGGYCITEYGENGTQSYPCGTKRRDAREMYLSMELAAQILEDIEYEKQKLINEKVK